HPAAPRPARAPVGHRGPATRPGPAAARLRVRPPLPERHGPLPRGGPAGERCGRRALHPMLAAHAGVTPTPAPLLEAEGLTKHFPGGGGLLGRVAGVVRAVATISFRIEPGTTLGLVGESGCGKTTTSRLVLGLERPTAGAIRFAGMDVLALDRDGLRGYRRS